MECNFQLVSDVSPKIPLEEHAAVGSLVQIIWSQRS